MSKLAKMQFKTPLVGLQWVNVSGQGKLKYDPENKLDKDDANSYQYTATGLMTKEQADEVNAVIKQFWRENKPAGATKMKYDLVKPVTEPTLDADGKEQMDEDGVVITTETGMFSIGAKTNTVWGDGKANLPKVMRANKAPLNLGGKVIGEGSEGVIHGTLTINAFKGNEGVNFYLSAIQLKKFVEHTGSDVDADDLGDEEGLDGLDMDDAEDISDQSVSAPAI